MTTPKPLFKGARVALLSMSGPVDGERLAAGIAALREMGLEPVVYDTCRAKRGYLAGDDALRAADITRAFLDGSIDGVLCARGGYGAHRVLPLLDMDAIAAHPKYFSGYSDVTAMHIALNLRGVVTYHTVMPAGESFAAMDEYTRRELCRAMFGGLTGMIENAPGVGRRAITGGMAEGELAGGNLSLIQQSLATPWEIDTRGRILFMEDVDEKPYRIDAMLTALRNAGKLDACAGVLLGYFTRCTADAEHSLALEQVFDDILAPLGVPVLAGLSCGHDTPACALPLGARVRLDAGAGTLEVL